MNSYKDGFINDAEWLIYNDWYEFLVTNLADKLNGIIYLRTNPNICLDRKNRRARIGEEKIPLNYLQEIHNRHEDWLIKKSCDLFDKNIPILSLDCDEEFETNEQKQKEHLDKTNDFIKKLNNKKGL